MSTRILTAIILLAVSFMGILQGIKTIYRHSAAAILFDEQKTGRMIQLFFGILTVTAAVFILLPELYLVGNTMMAMTILLLICLHLSAHDWRKAAVELPFLLLNLLLIWLQYPLPKQK
jgi:hypothetical protein